MFFSLSTPKVRQLECEGVPVAFLRVAGKVALGDDMFGQEPAQPGAKRAEVTHDRETKRSGRSKRPSLCTSKFCASTEKPFRSYFGIGAFNHPATLPSTDGIRWSRFPKRPAHLVSKGDSDTVANGLLTEAAHLQAIKDNLVSTEAVAMFKANVLKELIDADGLCRNMVMRRSTPWCRVQFRLDNVNLLLYTS